MTYCFYYLLLFSFLLTFQFQFRTTIYAGETFVEITSSQMKKALRAILH